MHLFVLPSLAVARKLSFTEVTREGLGDSKMFLLVTSSVTVLYEGPVAIVAFISTLIGMDKLMDLATRCLREDFVAVFADVVRILCVFRFGFHRELIGDVFVWFYTPGIVVVSLWFWFCWFLIIIGVICHRCIVKWLAITIW